MIRRVLLILILAIGTAGLGLWLQYTAFKEQPLARPATTEADQSLLFEVPPGMSLRALATELTALGALAHPYYFLALAHLSGDAARVKAGEYEIPPGMTPPELLERLVRNQVVQRSITLIEGWTTAQLLAAQDRREAPLRPGALQRKLFDTATEDRGAEEPQGADELGMVGARDPSAP